MGLLRPVAGLRAPGPTRRFGRLAACLLLLLPSFLACASQEVAGASEAAFYQVQGMVEAVDLERSRVKVRHEAIPDFRDVDGEVIGMDAMAMWFGVDDPTALAEGEEKIFRLRIDWLADSATDRARVVAWADPDVR